MDIIEGFIMPHLLENTPEEYRSYILVSKRWYKYFTDPSRPIIGGPYAHHAHWGLHYGGGLALGDTVIEHRGGVITVKNNKRSDILITYRCSRHADTITKIRQSAVDKAASNTYHSAAEVGAALAEITSFIRHDLAAMLADVEMFTHSVSQGPPKSPKSPKPPKPLAPPDQSSYDLAAAAHILSN